MLNEAQLKKQLPIGRFGRPLHVFDSIGSTNDQAAELAAHGAPEGTIVVAGEQTAGRGRHGRSWDTPIGAGLAISLILRPPAAQLRGLGLIGALAVVEALRSYDLQAAVKWPNDVLLGGKKVCGVLAEAGWNGEQLEQVVLGIGINLMESTARGGTQYEFPAISIERALGRRVDPTGLMVELLHSLDIWYRRWLDGVAHPDWEQYLAYRFEPVTIMGNGPELRGRVLGLTAEGALRLQLESGETIEIAGGGARLRPVESGLA